MASVKTNFAVGLFIITGIAVVAVVVIYVGASTYLKPGRLYSAFFNESVQGLSKDSPVKYRGVPVGQVHDIRIAEDGRLVEVVLRIDSDWKPDENTIAQLKAIGITGIMFVELDIREASDQVLKPDLQSFSENPVIPTTTSDIRQLLSGVSDVVKQMKAIDLKGISRQVRQTVKDIDTSFKHAEIKKISERLQSAIDKANHILNTRQWDEIINSVAGTSHDLNNFAEKANRTTGHLDSLITENEDKLTEAISSLQNTMKQANRLIDNGTKVMGQADESIDRIEKSLTITIKKMEETSRHLNRLSEKSLNQPSQLFFSAPLPAKKIESDK